MWTGKPTKMQRKPSCLYLLFCLFLVFSGKLKLKTEKTTFSFHFICQMMGRSYLSMVLTMDAVTGPPALRYVPLLRLKTCTAQTQWEFLTGKENKNKDGSQRMKLILHWLLHHPAPAQLQWEEPLYCQSQQCGVWRLLCWHLQVPGGGLCVWM